MSVGYEREIPWVKWGQTIGSCDDHGLESKLHPHAHEASAAQLCNRCCVGTQALCCQIFTFFKIQKSRLCLKIPAFRHRADQTKAQLLCWSGPQTVSLRSPLSRSARTRLLLLNGSSSLQHKTKQKTSEKMCTSCLGSYVWISSKILSRVSS